MNDVEGMRWRVKEILETEKKPHKISRETLVAVFDQAHRVEGSIRLEDLWKLGIVVDERFAALIEIGALPRPRSIPGQVFFESKLELLIAYHDLGRLTLEEEDKLEDLF